MGTAEALQEILELARHNHRMMHWLLHLQGVEKDKIDQILAVSKDSSEWEKLIGQMDESVADLKATVKANQPPTKRP